MLQQPQHWQHLVKNVESDLDRRGRLCWSNSLDLGIRWVEEKESRVLEALRLRKNVRKLLERELPFRYSLLVPWALWGVVEGDLPGSWLALLFIWSSGFGEYLGGLKLRYSVCRFVLVVHSFWTEKGVPIREPLISGQSQRGWGGGRVATDHVSWPPPSQFVCQRGRGTKPSDPAWSAHHDASLRRTHRWPYLMYRISLVRCWLG